MRLCMADATSDCSLSDEDSYSSEEVEETRIGSDEGDKMLE